MSDCIIRPLFFTENSITSPVYLGMLKNFVFPQISEVESLIFQQDGIPPHFVVIVSTSLDAQFPGQWIGRVGLFSQPPWSPDLIPMDFFFWCFMKRHRVQRNCAVCCRLATADYSSYCCYLWICWLRYGLKSNIIMMSAGQSTVLT